MKGTELKQLVQPPSDPGFVQNPYGFYERARESGDLFYWQDYGRVCAVSHRSVNALLRDRNWGRETQALPTAEWLEPFRKLEEYSLLEMDPPRHTRLRNAVSRAFTSRAAAAFAPMITDIADHLIAELGGHSVVELQRGYAELLPLLTITRILGVPDGMEDSLIGWSRQMVAMYVSGRTMATEQSAGKAAFEFAEFMTGLLAERRRTAAGDLMSSLVAAEMDGQPISDPELLSTCVLLLNAGHEATACAIGNAIKAVVNHCSVDQRPNRPGQAAKFVEEALRWDPPLHMFERHAKTDSRIFGHSFCRGETVGLLLAAANRDPAVFRNPQEFDPSRADLAANAAFGAGVHFCLGAPLARLEIAIALERLFNKWPDLSLVGAPRYAARYHFRGLENLNAKITTKGT